LPDHTPSHSREWDASAYHRISDPQASWGQKVLSRLKLRGDEVLLDAGCGTGRLTEELLQQLPDGRVMGVDLSQNMLLTARHRLQPEFGKRAYFVAADLQDLPFEKTFDGIFSTAAFHWVPDHRRLFGSLFHALRPGGWLLAQCGGGPNLARLRNRMDAVMAAPQFAPFFANFRGPWVFNDAGTAANLLREAGFVEVHTNVESALTVFENVENFSEFIRTAVLRLHLQEIPDPALRAGFVSELTHQAARDDPPYSLDYWRLNLAAKRPA
jgi:trans-aconitate 2-methyltransferase